MIIRNAKIEDLEEILAVYDIAKKYMCDHGNPTQWADGYPRRELLESDIAKQHLYVCTGEEDGRIHGVMAFILGDDPTYRLIEDGQWLNDEYYGTIHRIASDGTTKGIFKRCMAFCLERVDNVRIDTHADNKTMQNAVLSYGFEKCGRIYCDDGTPRIAYQFIKKEQ